MAQEQSSRITCQECGAKLPPDVRYCLSCYSPVGAQGGSHSHTKAAGAVNSTRRTDDPTIVFLPDQRELIQKRSRRRKRLVAAGSIALVIIIAGLIAFDTINSRRLATERKLLRENMARRELSLLADGLERFRADLGRYPNDDEGIAALTRKTAASKFRDGGGPNYWTGPYVDGVFEVDPWGNDYVYRLTDGGQRFELFSYGPGGEGGSGPRMQITSSTSLVN